MKGEKEELLQWHSAFYAGLQIELKEEAENLTFENEHTLSTKPMQIDVLVIKKITEKKIQKNIGRIFRKHNIIEYKSPDDYLSIDDFYKVYGYTCFYKADTGKVNEIKTKELTISFVCNHYPEKLIRHLETERNIRVEEQEEGIYYIKDPLFPIQLILAHKLSEKTNLWLKSLNNNLKEKRIADRLIGDYKKNKENKLYGSIMNIVVKANEEIFKEERTMCEALEELYKDKMNEIISKAVNEQVNERVNQIVNEQVNQIVDEKVNEIEKQKLIERIGKKIAKGKSIEQIADELEEAEDLIAPLYRQLVGE